MLLLCSSPSQPSRGLRAGVGHSSISTRVHCGGPLLLATAAPGLWPGNGPTITSPHLSQLSALSLCERCERSSCLLLAAQAMPQQSSKSRDLSWHSSKAGSFKSCAAHHLVPWPCLCQQQNKPPASRQEQGGTGLSQGYQLRSTEAPHSLEVPAYCLMLGLKYALYF